MPQLNTVLFGSDKTSLKLTGRTIPCFILDTREYVLSKKAIGKALGYDGKSERWLTELLRDIVKFRNLPEELSGDQNTILFEIPSAAGVTQTHKGISVLKFLEMCRFLVDAKKDGHLN